MLIHTTELIIFTWILISQSHSQNPNYENTLYEIYYSSQSSTLNKIYKFYTVINKHFCHYIEIDWKMQAYQCMGLIISSIDYTYYEHN